jgi:hypothetical protein
MVRGGPARLHIGVDQSARLRLAYSRVLCWLRTSRWLGDDGFAAAWSQGQGLMLAEAVGYVTRGRGPRSKG